MNCWEFYAGWIRVGKPESHVIGIAFHGNAKKGSHKGVRQVRWHRG